MPDHVQDAAVWQRYETDRPPAGRDLNQWILRLSEESGIAPVEIRRVVARGAGAMMNAISERLQSNAQQIADIIGADLVAALEVLRDCFTATRKKVLLDRSGRPKLVDDSKDGPGYVPSNMIYIEVEDHNVRLGAARSVLEIYGAHAPQKMEIDQKIVTLDITPNAAFAELERLARELPKLRAAIALSQQAATGVARRRTTIEGTVGD